MKNQPSGNNSLKFIFVAVVLMLLADYYLFGGTRSYIEDAKQQAQEQKAPLPAPVRVRPGDGAEFFESDGVIPTDAIPDEVEGSLPRSEDEDTPIPPDGPGRDEDVEENAPLPPVTQPKREGAVKVAIIIDDLGMDLKRSRAIMDLPAPITLAFLPYGTKTKEYAQMGVQKGHELIIHTPMEAMDSAQNIGPGGLKSGMEDAAFEQNFNTMLNSFDGYEGINNHMGSKLTQDRAEMDELMGILKKRGLFFVDSKTINTSVAARAARAAGVPYAERDVFLDHVDSRAFVDGALRETEAVAMRKGYAIAIGHPKTHTIEGLRAWIPTLASKGIELVPVSELLVRPSNINRHSHEGGDPLPQGEDRMDPGSQVSVTPDGVTSSNVRDDDLGEEPTDAVPEQSAPLLLHLPPQQQLPAIY